jgi:signal transduction histidine kinase
MFDVNSGANDRDPTGSVLEDRHEHIRAAREAREALLARPRFSLRLQIYLAFLIAFLLATGVATVLVVATYQVETKIQYLEIVNDFAMQLEEVRRFEKNFFLYGTGLEAAQQALYQASKVLDRNEDELVELLGATRQAEVLRSVERYEQLLDRLSQLELEPGQDGYEDKKKDLERELRSEGRSMVALSQELVDREKQSMSTAISRTRNLHFGSLAVLAISMLFLAYILGSRLLSNIVRFESYARRIAAGDFTPIRPARRYRDEFTALALSINDMLLEIESHEAGLIQSHKMRAVGTLTAGVAHELNNPLNNITLTTHMLLEDYESLDDAECREMIEDVIEEADRAKAIVSNLLDFARESGTKLEPLELNRLVQDTINLAANEVKLAGVKVEYRTSGNLPRIHGDRQQLRQVFLNLILNAVDASSKGGKIEILVLPADDPNEVAVKIIDFGSGIPESIRDRVFDPFFTTKDKGKGTGLGLSVSQGIIAKHGGQIRVTSHEGEGTTFTVSLPVTTISTQP